MELRGVTRVWGRHRVLQLDGVIDLSTLPTLHDLLGSAALQQLDDALVVDLDGVTALDDCGLGVLLGAAGRFREQGRELMVLTTSPRLRRRFELTGLDRALRVLDSVAGAESSDD